MAARRAAAARPDVTVAAAQRLGGGTGQRRGRHIGRRGHLGDLCSGQQLAPTIKAYTAQLDAGVRQYSDIATAAAQLVSAANSGAGSARSMSEQRYRGELVAATDRLSAWAQAFDELGRLRQA